MNTSSANTANPKGELSLDERIKRIQQAQSDNGEPVSSVEEIRTQLEKAQERIRQGAASVRGA